MKIINQSKWCEKVCPGTPIKCNLEIGHKGNHIAQSYSNGIFEKPKLLAEWNDKKVVKIDEAWADSIPKKYR